MCCNNIDSIYEMDMKGQIIERSNKEKDELEVPRLYCLLLH